LSVPDAHILEVSLMNQRNNNEDMKMRKQKRAKLKAQALEDYRRGDPLKVIAIRYRVSIATVSLWAAGAGLARRRRGPRIKVRPDARDLEIVNAVRAVVDGKPTLAEIGKRWGTTRANVHRIFHTWKNWEPTVPFTPGDIVRFQRRDFEVVEPGVFGGKVRSLRTGQKSTIPWKAGEHIAVKLGACDEADTTCGNSVGAASAPEAQALLEQMVHAGKLVGHDHTPDGGGHPTRVYRRCDSCDRCDPRERS
jgi:hypothetical protein